MASNLDTLVTNLKAIHTEVMTKIIPENIKKGVTIFGVTGTYEPDYEELGTVTPEEYTEAQTQIDDLFGEEETE